MITRTLRTLSVAASAALLLSGCALADSGRPTFEHERIRMATLVDGIGDSIPAEIVISRDGAESSLTCGKGDLIRGTGDGAQITAIRRIDITPDFDAVVWMDTLAAEYEKREGWRIDRGQGGDPGMYSDSYWGPGGNYILITLDPGRMTADGFSGRDDAIGDPAQSITIASSSECADKPDNFDNFGDFLEDDPLPTPLPALPEK